MQRYNLLEWALGALMLSLVLVVFTQVVVRYATYEPLAWTEEVARLLFIWASLVGAAVGSLRARHFAITLIYDRLSGVFGRIFRTLVGLCEVAFYVCLIWGGAEVTQIANQQHSVVIGLPMSVGYGVIPFAATIMAFATLYRIVRSLWQTGS